MTRNKRVTQNRNPESGFTIVELAMVLIIFGLTISTVMVALRLYTSDRAYNQTVEALEDTEIATRAFQLETTKYPCPADPTLAPNDPNYGVADCAAAGVITVLGRDGDNADGDNNLTTGRDQVLIGAVPFIDLIDPDSDPATDSPYDPFTAADSLDGWGSKITYAVTRNLTNDTIAPYDHEVGAISVVDENNVNILDSEGIAHFVLISHGENSKGSFTREGNYVDDCVDVTVPAEVAAMTKIPKDERENCDHEEPLLAEAIFLKGVRNDLTADYNDDIVKFAVSSVNNLWTYTSALFFDNGTPGNPADDFIINQIANTNGGNIGIGIDTPLTQLHLEGDIQAFEMHTEGLCDSAGDPLSCLPPEYIGGSVASMQCPSGQVVTSIGRPTPTVGNPNPTPQVNCASAFGSTPFSPCGIDPISGLQTFLTGVSSLTGPICSVP